MNINQQCLCCGSVYDPNNKLISPPTKPNHQCSANHRGPWTTINMHPNGYINHAQNGVYYQNDEVQKSSSFKSSTLMAMTMGMDDSKMMEMEHSLSMEIDLSSYGTLLIEAFKSEIHEYNTEVELTFGAAINFIEKFAIFLDNIDNYKMNDIISIVMSKKQEVFLSETVNNDKLNEYQMQSIVIDEKPVYVRCILQLIYFSFLNFIYIDDEYADFYKTYYKTESDIEEEQLKQEKEKKRNIILIKPKSNLDQDVDPFFQCFYECCAIYNIYNIKKKKISLREYLELITSSIVTVLKLINKIIIWINDIKLNSIRLILPSSNIDISLYEFSQLLQCIHLQTQHAVWQRIQKNSENQISDKQNLSLCIHILLCIAIKDKSGNAQYPNTQNPDKIYAEFLNKIVSCLSIHFLNKKNNDQIIMEFGDLVEKLPLWLLNCDKILNQ